MSEKTQEREILKRLDLATNAHLEAMTEMSKCLAKLGEVTESTLKAINKGVKASKELSLLLLVLLGDHSDTRH